MEIMKNKKTIIGLVIFVILIIAIILFKNFSDNDGNIFTRILTSNGTWYAWKTITMS